MYLLAWPDGGGPVRRELSTPPYDLPGPWWLDLDLRHDPAEKVIQRIFGNRAMPFNPREPQPRAKVAEAGDFVYVLLHEVEYDEAEEIRVRNAHFFLTRDRLVSVHAECPAGLAAIREEAPAEVGPQGVDHLFYLISAAMVERSFPALDAIAEAIERVEESVFPHPAENVQSVIFDLRKDLLHLRRTIGPMREVFSVLARRENPVFDREAALRLGGVYDRLVRLYELIDLQRDLVGSLMELYLSALSNRLNEIMKTLTIIATIMMPLTVIVGIYGMNFRHMPELESPYGYPSVLLAMLLVAGGMLAYFRRRRWF